MQASQVSENFWYDLQHNKYFYAYCFAASHVGKEMSHNQSTCLHATDSMEVNVIS